MKRYSTIFLFFLKIIWSIIFVHGNANIEEYGFLLDGGSSGTRLNTFSWHPSNVLETITFHDSFKTRPGISEFADKDNVLVSLENYLTPLVNLAVSSINHRVKSGTRIHVILQLTAGMRLLSPEKQQKLLVALENVLKKIFITDNKTLPGVKIIINKPEIITGEQEGFFDWLSINTAYQRLRAGEKTYGALDLGGASTQIAFESNKKSQGHSSSFNVLTNSRLSYGLHEAFDRLIKAYILPTHPTTVAGLTPQSLSIERHINTPCLPVGSSKLYNESNITLIGTGNYKKCSELLNTLIPEWEAIRKVQDSKKVTQSETVLDTNPIFSTSLLIDSSNSEIPKVFIALDNFPKIWTLLGQAYNPCIADSSQDTDVITDTDVLTNVNVMTDAKLVLENQCPSPYRTTDPMSIEAIDVMAPYLCSKTFDELKAQNLDRPDFFLKDAACFGPALLKALFTIYGIAQNPKESPFVVPAPDKLAFEGREFESSWALGSITAYALRK
eukprot:g2974.t1